MRRATDRRSGAKRSQPRPWSTPRRHSRSPPEYLRCMARLEFDARVTVKAAPERAFDYFADYRHVAGVLEEVRRWEPIVDRASGAGAGSNVEVDTRRF